MGIARWQNALLLFGTYELIFSRLYLIAQFRRLLEILISNGNLEAVLKLGNLVSKLLGHPVTGGYLADMQGSFMHGLDQTLQSATEDIVARTAPQAPVLFESGLGKPASLTG